MKRSSSVSSHALDTVESSRYPDSKADSWTFLVDEFDRGLFQVMVRKGGSDGKASILFVRFAYTNPESVQEPFFGFVEWAMGRYDLRRSILASDDLRTAEGQDRIETPSDLRRVALPLIETNRRLWHADVGTDEQAALRPDDAVKRFFGPLMELSPMDPSIDSLVLDNYDLSFILELADTFGFLPLRDVWYESLKRDYQIDDEFKTWRTTFRSIGTVEEAEAHRIGRALADAAAWLAARQAGTPPTASLDDPDYEARVGGMGAWMGRWLQEPGTVLKVEAASRFASRGAFRVVPLQASEGKKSIALER